MMDSRILAVYGSIVLAAVACSAAAETALEKGHAIAAEADQRDTGWQDVTTELRMVLRNRHGEESVRELRISFFEIVDDGDKSLLVFDRPADIKRTALLTYTHANRPDDQWLYLPVLKRVKRISSRNKSGPFVGSEFAYEDISSNELAKYTYKFIREELLGKTHCFVLERYPVYRDSGYTRQIVWFDKDEYRFQRIDYYDRKNDLLKTLTYSGYRQYLDRYWRADEMRMVNHQTKKSTVLTFSNFRFRTGLGSRDFNRSALKRGR